MDEFSSNQLLWDDDHDDAVDAVVDDFIQDGPDLFGNDPADTDAAPIAQEVDPCGKDLCSSEPIAVVDDEGDVAPIPVDDLAETEAVTIADPDDGAEADLASGRTSTPSASSALDGSAGSAPGEVADDTPAEPLALYRRYRPDVFQDVIGQEHVTGPLMRALENNKVAHAYLFSGPRGCGKTTSARILARCLNCVEGPTPTPCGVCQSCRDLSTGGPGSIDVIEIDAASHGGVDDARDLREKAFFAPVDARYKIYIVDEAHMVTTQGFNALLKLVEEPPPHVKFIFATTEPEKVIGTIRSRTHHYPFRLVPPKVMTGFLEEICARENVDVEPSVLPLVIRAGGGSVRDSLSILDQLLGGVGAGPINYQQAMSLLGYTPDVLLDEVVDAFAARDGDAVFRVVDRIMESGQDPRGFVQDLLNRLRDLMIISLVPDALSSGLINAPDFQVTRLQTQASNLGHAQLTRATEIVSQTLMDMRGTTAPRLTLELMCSKVLLPGVDGEDGILTRLDRLERRINMAESASGEPALHPRPATPANTHATMLQPDRGGDGEETQAEPTPSTPSPASSGQASPSQTVAQSAPPAPSPSTPQTVSPATPTRQVSGSMPRRPGQGPSAAPVTSPSSGSANGQGSDAQPTAQHHSLPDSSGPASSGPSAPTRPVSAAAAQISSSVAKVTTDQLRAEWPDLLDLIRRKKKSAWVALEKVQVADYSDNTLTLMVANSSASFGLNSTGIPVLTQVLQDRLGISPRFTIVEGGAPVPDTPRTPSHPQPSGFSTDSDGVDAPFQSVNPAQGSSRESVAGTESSWAAQAKERTRPTATTASMVDVYAEEANDAVDVDNDQIVETSLDSAVKILQDMFEATVVDDA